MAENKPKPIRPLSQKDIERFWSKVDKRGPDECWPWLGGKTTDGYGRFKYGRCEYKAIRVGFYLQTGKAPDPALCILHSCDNPPCQNVAHLREGTTLENMQDKMARNRTVKGDAHYSRTHPERLSRGVNHYAHLHPEIRQGERNGRAKLTENDVREIRRRGALGESGASIARSFGGTKEMIYFVLNGLTWKHVPRQPVQLSLF